VGVRHLPSGSLVILTAQLERIARVVEDMRPDWPFPSIVRALCSLDGRETSDIALAAVRVAADPESKSPTRITLAGPWWSPVDNSDRPKVATVHQPPPFRRENVRPADPEWAHQLVEQTKAQIRAARPPSVPETQEPA
jgi:hypothetical protein